ncbi:hypothetical protein JOD20_003147 [Herpetosiphon giganteus]|nr:hypothetical protein [Herpetosiphon giganteus]
METAKSAKDAKNVKLHGESLSLHPSSFILAVGHRLAQIYVIIPQCQQADLF